MIFKEVLAATGVIELLPEFFFCSADPDLLSLCADFFFWNDRSRKPSYDCAVYANGHGNRKQRAALSLFVLLMCINYVAMQVSPVHICLTLCAEDYRVPLSSMVAKTMPMVFVFTAISFLYYGLLRFVGL